MIKHLLIAFLIFGFFITNAQDRQEIIQRAEARLKSLNLVDFPSPYGHMDMGINNQTNLTFRGGVKHRLDRIEIECGVNTGSFMPCTHLDFVYNADQLCTDFIYSLSESGSGVYIPYFAKHYYYENKRVIRIETENFLRDSGQTLKESRTSFHYNSKGLVDLVENDDYDHISQYVPRTKEILIYDNDDRLILDTLNIYISDSASSRIFSTYIHDYVYNEHGLLKESRSYLFDESKSIRHTRYRHGYTYDSNNFLILASLELWDSVNAKFFIDEQYRATYNSFGGMNLLEHGFDDGASGTWGFYEKQEFINDNNVGQEDLLIPLNEIFTQGNDFNRFSRKILSDTYSRYIPLDNIWKTYSKSIYIYSQQIVINTEDAKLEGVSFYPNPVESSLSIRNQKGAGIFELFNVQGQKIVHQEVVGDAQVDLTQQMSGFYFYKMTIGGKSATGKLVKN